MRQEADITCGPQESPVLKLQHQAEMGYGHFDETRIWDSEAQNAPQQSPETEPAWSPMGGKCLFPSYEGPSQGLSALPWVGLIGLWGSQNVSSSLLAHLFSFSPSTRGHQPCFVNCMRRQHALPDGTPMGQQEKELSLLSVNQEGLVEG